MVHLEGKEKLLIPEEENTASPNSISFEEKTHSSRFSVPAKAPSPQYSRLSEKTMDLRFLHSEKAFLPISNIWIPSAEEGTTAYLRDKGFVTPIILPCPFVTISTLSRKTEEW